MQKPNKICVPCGPHLYQYTKPLYTFSEWDMQGEFSYGVAQLYLNANSATTTS